MLVAVRLYQGTEKSAYDRGLGSNKLHVIWIICAVYKNENTSLDYFTYKNLELGYNYIVTDFLDNIFRVQNFFNICATQIN